MVTLLKNYSLLFLFFFLSSSSAYSQKWKSLGPFITPADAGASYATGIGRINGITFHPQYSSNKTIYAAAPTAGLYISKNNGIYWDKVNMDVPLEGASEVVFAPDNYAVMYVASGDRDGIPDQHMPDGATEFSQSIGMIISYDGGKTFFNSNENWGDDTTFWNYPSHKNITSIVALDNGVVMCSMYHLDRKKNSAKTGYVFRSSDHGRTWKNVLTVDSAFFREMIQSPKRKNDIYVAGTRLFYSSEGGAENCWKEIGLNENNYSRIELASSKSSPEIVYALACPVRSRSPELYIIKENKATYIRSYKDLFSGETRFCYVLEAMDNEKGVLYFGNVALFRSDDLETFKTAGNWYSPPSDPSYIHADIHALRSAPDSNVIYAGHDGGISRSYDNGRSWQNISNNLDVSKIYRLSFSQHSERMLAGTQDAGTMLYDEQKFPEKSWGTLRGGDGGDCIISRFSDSVFLYTDGQNNQFAISTDSGKHWRSATPRGERGDFLKPLREHPFEPATFFIGYHDVYKTTDYCRTWKKISDFTSLGINKDLKLIGLEVSESNPSVIYASYHGPVWSDLPDRWKGVLFRTEDSGKTWTDISAGLKGISFTQVKTIAVDPTNPDIIYVGFGGSWVFRIMQSVDGGKTWKDFSEGLTKEHGINSIMCYGKNVYAGTHRGVYVRKRYGAQWKRYGKGFPNIPVFDLDVNRSKKLIRAATGGRGIWEIRMK